MPRRPAPAKLSRVDSQAQTRTRLLATATTCFLRDGYAETSMEAIAAAAGFTKGAVYSNFPSKVELCQAVLDAIRAERIAALGRAIAGVTTVDALAAALERWADAHIGDPAWTRLEVEFGVHASRHPALAKQLARRHQEVRARVAALIAAWASAHRVALPLPDSGSRRAEIRYRRGMRLGSAALVVLVIGACGKGSERAQPAPAAGSAAAGSAAPTATQAPHRPDVPAAVALPLLGGDAFPESVPAGLLVIVGDTAIVLDGNPAVPIRDGAVPASDLAATATDLRIPKIVAWAEAWHQLPIARGAVVSSTTAPSSATGG